LDFYKMNNPSEPSAMRTAWLVVALLVPVALLNYLDRQLLAAMKTSIGISIPALKDDANWGLLPALFKWSYAIFSPLGGYIADRFNKRWIIGGSLFVWSAVTIGTGNCSTYESMKVMRTLMGISEAFYIPAALALISDFHLGGTRSRAIGFHQMGIYIGVIIGGFSGYAAGNPEAPGYNVDQWRLAFDACGIVGMIYAVPLVFLLRDAPRAPGGRGTELSPLSAMKELFSTPSYVLLAICFTLPAIPGWVIRDWMPAILKSGFDISQGMAGVLATVFVNVAAIAGAATGGLLADRFSRKTIRGRVIVSATGLGIIALTLPGMGATTSLVAAVVFLTVYGIGWGFFDCNNMPILSQIARPELRATGYGFMNLISISIGGAADVGFGVLRKSGIGTGTIFAAFALLVVISIVCMLSIRPQMMDPKQSQ
jgi:MFS transporter, Spinster family, sphingosine-1-phosphate transporter